MTYARLAGWTPQRGIDEAVAAARTGPCSTAGSCRAAPGSAGEVEAELADYDARRARPGRSARSSTTCRRGTCAARATGCAPAAEPARPGGGVRDAPRRARRPGPDDGADPAVPVRDAVPEPRRARSCPAPPDSVHLTRWPAAELAAHRDERARAVRWRSRAARSTSPGRCARRPGSGRASRWRGLAGPARPRPRRRRRAAAADRRRDQRQGGRADRRRVDAGRAARQAAPAEDRQAARVGDPGGDGRRPRRRGRRSRPTGRSRSAGVTLGARRGRDPGDAATGNGGRPRRGLVVVIDTQLTPELRAEGDARELAARDPGPPPRCRARARRPDRPVARRPPGRRSRRTRRGRRRHAGRPRDRRRRARRRHALRPSSCDGGPVGDRAPPRHADGARRCAIDDVGRRRRAWTRRRRRAAATSRRARTGSCSSASPRSSSSSTSWPRRGSSANVSPGESSSVVGDLDPARRSARTPAALFGLFRDNAVAVRAGVDRGHRPDRRLPRRGRAEPATCRSRSACCSAARSAT